MNQELWKEVDQYLNDSLQSADPFLEAALADNAAAGLPHIDVAPNQGKLLHLLARMTNAKRILEIGTLGGYSTIWLARALPPTGRLITLELEPTHAEVARKNIERAGLSFLVEICVGPAVQSLERLQKEGTMPFDLIFIDADKESYPEYVEWALRLARPGTVIICDNVVRKGAVIESAHKDPSIQGIRRMFEQLRNDSRLEATAMQTVGSKGYDGFILAVVN